MAFDLSDSHRKYQRAQHHVDCLNAEIQRFVSRKPYAFFRHFDAKRGCHVFKAQTLDAVPDFAVMLGDFLHNARSALDCIAWQAAVDHIGCRKASDVRTEIYFPLAGSTDALLRCPLWKHIDQSRISLFQERQPYRRPNEPDAQLLLRLSSFSNSDKHRMIHATKITGSDPPPQFVAESGSIVSIDYKPGISLEGNAEIEFATVRMKPPEAQVNVQHVTIDVAFGKAADLYPVDLYKILLEVDRMNRHFEQRWPAPGFHD